MSTPYPPKIQVCNLYLTMFENNLFVVLLKWNSEFDVLVLIVLVTAQNNFYNPYADNQHLDPNSGNSQRYCKWRGTITEVLVYLDVLAFPSTCIYPVPIIDRPFGSPEEENLGEGSNDVMSVDALLIENIKSGTFKSNDSNDDICTRSLCGTCSSSCCCDSSCIEHGDCCDNYEDTCEDSRGMIESTFTNNDDNILVESCDGSCGFCLQQCCCSSDCGTFEDCCEDYDDFCGD